MIRWVEMSRSQPRAASAEGQVPPGAGLGGPGDFGLRGGEWRGVGWDHLFLLCGNDKRNRRKQGVAKKQGKGGQIEGMGGGQKKEWEGGSKKGVPLEGKLGLPDFISGKSKGHLENPDAQIHFRSSRWRRFGFPGSCHEHGLAKWAFLRRWFPLCWVERDTKRKTANVRGTPLKKETHV